MSLTGSASGANRASIVKEAHHQAATYYDTQCVYVTLANEQSESEDAGTLVEPHKAVTVGFSADWQAEISHRWENRTYGFPKCYQCGKENRS